MEIVREDARSLKFAIVGAGSVGAALAARLVEKGYQIQALISRDLQRTIEVGSGLNIPVLSSFLGDVPLGLDCIFLCVPDGSIEVVASQLAVLEYTWKNVVVAHTSGALPSRALSSLAQQGSTVMSFHPIQTFNRTTLPGAFEGIYIGIEGDTAAVKLGTQICKGIGSKPLVLTPEAKHHLHIAATFISNYFVVLAGAALEIASKGGIVDNRMADYLEPLVFSTWNRFKQQTPGNALSGPVVRSDAGTILSHIETLKSEAPSLVEIYVALASAAVRLAENAGRLSRVEAQDLVKIITDYAG